MAAIRARRWGSHEFWVDRIGGYLGGTYSPQQALARRAAWVAVQGEAIARFVAGHCSPPRGALPRLAGGVAFRGEAIAAFVAGHCTRRFNLDGELEWVNVAEEYR